MRGHQALIELRMARKSPKMVFINDWPCETDWFENPGDAVTICVHDDVIQSLDMRFLVGLRVSVSASSEIRAKALFEACKNAGAHTVASCHTHQGRGIPSGWTQIWSKQVKEIA